MSCLGGQLLNVSPMGCWSLSYVSQKILDTKPCQVAQGTRMTSPLCVPPGQAYGGTSDQGTGDVLLLGGPVKLL